MNFTPQEIHLIHQGDVLVLVFATGKYTLSAEFLRVYSPSAEVRGHGKGQEILQTGKRHVKITALTPIGHYALKITFSDGHDSGLYQWHYLYDLSINYEELWQNYLHRLTMAKASRDEQTSSH